MFKYIVKNWIFLIFLGISIMFFRPSNELKCNKALLNTYLLTGMKYPIYEKMKICP